ncbi:sigma factor-like helix-turn-helix DNA-binding protein [Nocardia sp. CDC160]|uniref:sigma factor-like helix-turn-helix DNA-binding protein n=1 Tax=Nocardia sp. CDC160 TaxID=3112166 RepID=UPI002DBA7038|nr:sigma factor-like helix-turn-helix DNA-binding protein [Nocardia sp. CDC160]MEC3915676.1 sigma factor-like helix-turn-helix DNA-binding protein [Nocardia sp. CDC160]
MTVDTASLPRVASPAVHATQPVARAATPTTAVTSMTAATPSRAAVPSSATLAAAASGRRVALAELLTYTHYFATACCRAELGANVVSDRLADQVTTAIITGWPTARTARRDFLEFAHTTIRRAVRLCRYEHSRPSLFAQLSDGQRDLLTLRVAVGLSPTETAVALGIPVLRVHRHTARALALLKRQPVGEFGGR